MRTFLIWLVLTASLLTSNDCMARQRTPSAEASAGSGPPTPFARVVEEYFSQWDSNGDGILSKDEIEAAVVNAKFHDEAAAAIIAIQLVVRGGKYALPPITKDYLAFSPLREAATSDEQTDSVDDVSKPEKYNHAPAFQPRYRQALRRLRHTSRELFPQNLPSFEATYQGKLGDCPFVATVGAMVYRNPAAVKAMFAQDDKGSFTVSFGDGRSIKITHLTDADIAMWSSAGTNGLWLTILEKAYRRILAAAEQPDRRARPSIYDKIGPNVRTIEILDGHQTHDVAMRIVRSGGAPVAELRHELIAAQRDQRLVMAGTPPGKRTPGITPGHAYAILGYNRETDRVLVWNPHGNNFIPKGPEGLKNGYATRTGKFEIPLKDAIQVFSAVTFETQALSRN